MFSTEKNSAPSWQRADQQLLAENLEVTGNSEY